MYNTICFSLNRDLENATSYGNVTFVDEVQTVGLWLKIGIYFNGKLHADRAMYHVSDLIIDKFSFRGFEIDFITFNSHQTEEEIYIVVKHIN